MITFYGRKYVCVEEGYLELRRYLGNAGLKRIEEGQLKAVYTFEDLKITLSVDSNHEHVSLDMEKKMNKSEAKRACEQHIMVQHMESPDIAGFIRCFDDEESGAYLDYHYVYVPLTNLQIFDVCAFANYC